RDQPFRHTLVAELKLGRVLRPVHAGQMNDIVHASQQLGHGLEIELVADGHDVDRLLAQPQNEILANETVGARNRNASHHPSRTGARPATRSRTNSSLSNRSEIPATSSRVVLWEL